MKDILYSVFKNKCPSCHKGNVFISNNPYNLKEFDKMHQTCTCCGEKYEKEPGYFYGAMYVSYGLMVGWFVITWAANTFIFNADIINYLIFLIATIVLFMTLTFRISRLIWLNFFIKFDEEKSKCLDENKKTK